MGFNRDVIRRRRDEMHELGVRVRWAGRAPRLWKSVIRELQVAEELTQRQHHADADDVRQLRRPRRADRRRPRDRPRGGRRPARPGQGHEKVFARHLYVPELPDADLVWRTSGEQRLSNFVLWQAAYSEMVFTDVLWPDVDRRDLWRAIDTYARRDRRYGGAVPNRLDHLAPGGNPGARWSVVLLEDDPRRSHERGDPRHGARRETAREPDVLREVFEGSYRRLVVQLYAVDRRQRGGRGPGPGRVRPGGGRGPSLPQGGEPRGLAPHRRDQPAPQPLAQDAQLLEDPLPRWSGPTDLPGARGARRGDRRAAGPAGPSAGGAARCTTWRTCRSPRSPTRSAVRSAR